MNQVHTMRTEPPHKDPSASLAAMPLVALAGNPNAGKTTLFNALTGARQHVGNYPGITVEKKEGQAKLGDVRLHLIDLPGTYSLTAYSQEELVARQVLAEQRPAAVVNVVSAPVLERNLYLTVQLMEMGAPVVVALNMMDEAESAGLVIDSRKLSELLGAPVVETVARSGRGSEELVRASAAKAAENSEWKPLELSYGPDIDPVLAEMVQRIQDGGLLTHRYPARWTAIKYLESDEEIQRLGREAAPELADELEAMAKGVADHLLTTLNTYPEAVIADYRYGFIASILKQDVLRRPEVDRMAYTEKIDRVLTHSLIGPLFMLAVLYGVYEVTFMVGEIPMGWLEAFFGWMGETAWATLPEGPVRSLVVSGIIDGVGGVMGFVPLIMVIFACIAMLEDSGYMARIAYILDRVFRAFGLHGCSIMPFIVSGGIAGGCAVPGIMAARTLRSPKEKLATILTAPFMSCGAKVPVFILLTAVFFPESEATAMFLLTMAGWVMALLVSKLLRSTVLSGPSTPFVMELPPYRLPTLKGVAIHTWERTWQYIKKAGTVILAVSILLWAAMTYPGLPEDRQANFDAQIAAVEAQNLPAEESQAAIEAVENARSQAELRYSLAGRVGTGLESISMAAGFDWRTNIALVGGFAAKEIIVSTLGTAYSLGEVDPEESQPLSERFAADPSWNAVRGVALMLFILLYAPCFVTVVVMKQETGGWKWPAFSMVFNTVLAFGLSVAVYQIGSAFLK